jgi:hypothetical protein
MPNHVPDREQAEIDLRKITHYLLDINHPIGSGKAKFFLERGFNVSAPEKMKAALLRHILERVVIKTEVNQFGVKYVVSCNITTPDGATPCIRSVWIVETANPIPRLVTAIPEAG